MTSSEYQRMKALARGEGQNRVYHNFEDHALHPDSHDLILPSSWIENDFESFTSDHVMPNLPPSLRDAKETDPFRAEFSQEIVIMLDEDHDELGEVAATAPLSFNQRSLRLAELHVQKRVESGAERDRTSFSSRADSAIGIWDDLANFAGMDDGPDGRLIDDRPSRVISEDYLYDSRSLQYHRIQPMPYADQGSLGHNAPPPRAGPSGPPSPSSRPSDSSHRLPCPICVNKAPFTGVYAHRNLNRHMESVHAPCASADGVKHIRCSFHDCGKTFRREDARLVHERRSHPELNRPPPSKRKRSGEL